MRSRVDPRFKKRMSCRLKQEQRTYAGLVLDVSRTGLFVQTSAGAKPGDEVEVLSGLQVGERLAVGMTDREGGP